MNRTIRILSIITAITSSVYCINNNINNITDNRQLVELPNLSNINEELITNLNIDQFFQLWQIFNNQNRFKITDEAFTILVPQNSRITIQLLQLQQQAEETGKNRELLQNLLLDHVLLERFDLTNLTKPITFQTLRQRNVSIDFTNSNKLTANNVNIIEQKITVPNGNLIIIDNYLFLDDLRNILNDSSTKSTTTIRKPTNFIDNVMDVLSYLKNGVRVFQHFLTKSNVTKLLKDNHEYTVFIPIDYAFQRWHPIDWGFYPFSVPEFTESVIVNHFVEGNLKQDEIKDGQVVKTIGGRQIVFNKNPNLLVNGAMIVKGDIPVKNGNIIFINEVLFVSESIVTKLHQENRDKETPPLLAFPWFGAQFLSHAFLKLERDNNYRFQHITRFLNLSNLSKFISGTNYTFFVPIDQAFNQIGLNKMPDNYLTNTNGINLLLNHFVKGRLYNKDLKDGTELTTLGNRTIAIKHNKDKVRVNDAMIVESEVFVYNLGTMFYIDKVLFVTNDILPTTDNTIKNTTDTTFPTNIDSETVPDELTITGGSLPDVLFADATTIPTINNKNETSSLDN